MYYLFLIKIMGYFCQMASKLTKFEYFLYLYIDVPILGEHKILGGGHTFWLFAEKLAGEYFLYFVDIFLGNHGCF